MTLIHGQRYVISEKIVSRYRPRYFTSSEVCDLIKNFTSAVRLLVWTTPSLHDSIRYKIGFEMDSTAMGDLAWYLLSHPDIDFHPLNLGGVSWLDSLLSDSEIQLLLHDSQI